MAENSLKAMRKVVRWMLWVLAGGLTLLAAAHFLLPYFIDADRFKSQILARIDPAVYGRADFADLRLALLPRPRAIVTQGQWVLPDRLRLQVASVAIYPQILPLLRGRLRVGTVNVHAPVVVIDLPEAPSPKEAKRTPDNAALDPAAGAAAALARLPRHGRLLLGNGQVTLRRGGRPMAEFHELALAVVEENGRLTLDLAGRSDLVDRFRLQAQLEGSSLDAQGAIDLTGIQITPWQAVLEAEHSGRRLFEADADLHLTFASQGMHSLQIALRAELPAITMTRGATRVQARELQVEGSAQLTRQGLRATLTRLRAAQPRLNLSGTLAWDWMASEEDAPLQLSAQVNDTDLTAVRAGLLALTADGRRWKLWDTIQGGTVVSMDANTSASTWSQLGKLAHLRLSGKAADGHVLVPGVALDLTGANGEWQLREGVLTVRQADVRWGTTRGANGTLSLDLADPRRPMDLAVDVEADLAQLPPFLKRVLHDPAVQAELARIRDLSGTAAGRLAITGSADGLQVKVDIATFALAAQYDRLPFPISAQGQTLTYSSEGLAFQEITAHMLASRMEGLGGRITWNPAPRMALQGRAVHLACAQLYPWLAALPGLQARLRAIESIDGRISLAEFQISGPPADAAQWQFQCAGRFDEVTLRGPRLPAGPLTLRAGRFRVQPERLDVAGTDLRLADSSLRIDAGVSDYRSAQPQATFKATGTIGDPLAQWLQDTQHVPAEFQVRAPIAIERLDLRWRKNDTARLEGRFKWPGDLKIEAALTWGPTDFFLEKLILSDAQSAAAIQLHHDSAPNTWDFSYKGLLEKATMAKLWRREQIYSGRLDGDFSAHLPLDAPKQSVVQGRLEGADVVVPLGAYGPLLVHHLDLGSTDRSLRINDLDFTFAQQRMGVTGDLLFSANALEPALTLTAESLDLGRLEQLLAKGASGDAPGESQAAPARPNVQGTVALRLGQLVYSPYTWEPMQATVVLAGDQTTVEVTRATLCGISTVGTVHWTPEGMTVELRPGARGATLRNAIGCLTGATTTERVEGTYDIDGKVTARGKSGQEMIAHLEGALHMKAVNGRVTNVGEVGLFTNLLSFLKINNLITGDLPNLRERDFNYKSIDLQLLFRDGFAELQETRLAADAFNLVAEGKMDLSDKQLALTVLVSPLTSVDAVVKHIPVVGKILQGTLVAIPVGVHGSLSNPKVVPLSPKAVGSRLLGILERTVQAPFELVEPILPKSKGQGQEESGSDSGSGITGAGP